MALNSRNMNMQALGDQFKGLDIRDPASWTLIPRMLLLLLVACLTVVALWFLWISGSDEELVAAQSQEESLRSDFQSKLEKAVSLDELKRQREQVLQYVGILEKQLPSKAEMDALLSDITQAGLGRSLSFDLFRPGQLQVKDYYAELPIALKMTGVYHNIGAFAADIANLSRIVILGNVSMKPADAKEKSGSLVVEATAKTFRYLDVEEIAAQKKANRPARK